MSSLKGKTYVEIYGKEKADEIRNKINKKKKGKTYEEIYGKEKALIIKKKQSKNAWSKKRKGKTWNEIYGKKRANNIKKKCGKNKIYEEIYGKERAKEIKLKMSISRKVWTKEKIMNNLVNIIKKIGPITRTNLKHLYHYYNICSEHTIRQRFGSLDRLAIESGVEFKLVKGGIGTNEKQILNIIEKEKNITLLRQFSIAGKYIDGYDRENNVAYEVDEWHHKYRKVEDIIRENQIKEVLDCEFVRIDEQKFLQQMEVV